ncbi:ATP-binding protein [Aquiflexum sp. TKW24L]|uniref:ATP-binding protein n=1 Tax=Aquiflexum sp. TKW24L TaxID=2942212 RepID=UPI0020C13228|nr:ATP-binding protein [Aquiflexum sp. TKW24L]MCL6257645.1 ATP-binding protein [Aquiflexum sp. TKW24L]
MKVTPALKQELAQWLDTYWTTYLKGDIETWATFLRDDYRNIGGTKEEIWNSKQEIIDYTYRILDQMLGTAEIRNREIEVIPYGEYMMVNEFTDLYVKIEGEWTFYGPFRMSSLLEKTDTGWIALHQHGSYPDMKAMEGEAFSIDAVKAENAKLLEAVKSRTLQLEIEAALEKVRAVAMGMKKPEDMLDVCRIISDQLQQFGVDKIRNVQLAIIDENIGQYLCYQYFTPYDKTAVEKTEYLKSPVEHGMVRQMLASRDGYFIGGLSGSELEEFRAHRKEENHFPDPFLDKATELDYCFLSIGEGGLGLTLYQPMAEDVLTLFKRFHQVFSLAYQRFRDIQKAEAQAREAQIEVAVERVRAQSMAMHHPDDLDKVNKEILTQLNSLQIQGLSGVTFYLVDQDGWVKAWDFSSPGNIGNQKSYTLQFDFKKYEMMGYPFKIFQQTDLNYLVADYPLEKLERAVFELEEINPEVATVVKEALAKGILTHQWSACTRITDGLLAIDLVSPPSEDTKTIVLKIAGAFNQAYQRFLDLQKAEAQAREAQIEASLERTRTQSMLMQHSDEIKSISNIFHEQLLLLGIPSEFSYVWLPDEASQSHQFWASWSEKNKGGNTLQSKQVTYPLDKTEPYTAACYAAWAHPDVILEEFIPPSDIAGFFEVWQELLAGATKLKADFFPEGIYYSEAYMRYGCFGINIRRKLSEEEKNILKRFSIEFERAYTRFLDLQKAEAQAREAQIEAALERVRAQTMAMHSSEDVGKCVVKMFSELTALGVDEGTRFGIGILNHDNENNQLWTARKNGEEVNMHIGNIDMASHPLLKSARKAWKEQNPLHKYVLEGEDLLNYYQMLNNAPDYKIQIPLEKLPKKEIQHCFIFEHGFFYAFSPREFQPDLIHITKRFSSLFEQTYRRYLDLVRAEGQAREAEIELALERVRARTMAMHHTEELNEVIQVVFDQFLGLNIHVEHAGFILDYKEKEDMHIWLATLQQGVPREITLPYFDSPHWNSYLEAKARQESFFANLLPFEVKNKFYKVLFEWIPELTEEAQQAIFRKPALAISTVLLDNVGLYVEHYSMTPYTAQENAILMRFGKVFQQTYTRFLDLQKAEAQARESQIEAALERVRSQAMAMHSSHELKDVARELRTQMGKLGQRNLETCAIHLYEESPTYFHSWAAVRPPQFEGEIIESEVLLPKDGGQLVDEMLNAYFSKQKEYVILVNGAKAVEWFALLKSYYPEVVDLIIESRDIEEKNREQENGFYFSFADFSGGSLVMVTYTTPDDESRSLLGRFANVFGIAYRRFSDLQKAEAQARESQIQLSLERIRAKAMAMLHSDELSDFLTVVFEQFDILNLGPVNCHLSLFDLDNNRITFRLTGLKGATLIATQEIDLDASPLWKQKLEDWKSGNFKDVDVLYTPFENLLEIAEIFKEILSKLPEDDLPLPEDYPNGQYAIDGYCKYGYLGYSASRPPSEEEKEITRRIANEFGNVYQRFLDLQKAEAQSKESQIQLALERVRARTMAMQHSDELAESAFVLFQQLQILGLVHERINIGVVKEESKTIDFWITEQGGNQINTRFTGRIDEPTTLSKMYHGWKNNQKLMVIDQTGEDLSNWLKYLKKEIGIPFDPAFIHNRRVQTVGFFSKGMLVLTTPEPLPDEHLQLLEKFAGVFDLTYTRFSDLKQAEAQAREAQIEAALERVRSKTMGMQRSEQLGETASLLFKQFDDLGINVWSSGFQIWNADDISSTAWMSSAGGEVQSTGLRLPHTEDPYFINIYKARRNPDRFFVMESKGKELEDTYRYMFNIPEWKKAFGDIEASGFPIPKYQITHSVYFTHGYLMLITHESYPEYWDIFKRFGKVFDQTYTRFLDLQRAEAQAREAQIEAALEKVRSRSLAMHKSSELNEVVKVLFEKTSELQVPSTAVGIQTFIEGSKDMMVFVCGDVGTGIVVNQYVLPYFDHPIVHDYLNAHNKKLESFVGSYSKKEKDSFYDVVLKLPELIELPTEVKTMICNSDFYEVTIVPAERSLIAVNDFQGNPLSESHVDILKRFAKVFDQTYTRFLDLQKAEAQAREAQIEAGLERVRSKSLAMHKTAELQSVIHTVHQELLNLYLSISGGSFIVINSEIDNEIHCWGSGGTAETSDEVHIPRFEKPFYTHLLERIKSGAGFFTEEYTREEKIEFFTFLFQHQPWSKLGAKEKKETLLAPGGYTRSCAVSKHTSIFIINHFGEKFSESENAILIRFGKVFEQTYARFLDLQKAEAQAREAQIELSLERIRSQVTAMQESSDLLDIVVTMRTEFVKLGHEAHYFWHMRWLPERYDKAMTSGDGTKIGMVMTLPRHIHGDIPLVADWEKTKEPTVVLAMEVETAVDYVHKMITLGDFEQVDPQAPTLDDIRHIGGLTFVMARTTHGEIGYSLPGVVTDPPKNAVDTLIRFAGVFDLAYKRFEDLKSAERQHREAQIQLALERVRARSLAMHRSEELADLSMELVKQVQTLGMESWFCAFNIYDDDPRGSVEWGSNGQGTFPKYRTPREGVFLRYFEAGQRGEILLVNEIGEDECPAHYEYLCSLPGVGEQLLQMKAAGIPFPTSQIDHVAFFKYGYVLFITYEPAPESYDIFKRFANVFEQSYTRFLDLQKAEAQAKEAQIETALERVRSRTMAMQSSAELGAVAAELFAQMNQLVTNLWTCGFVLCEKDRDEDEWWLSMDGDFTRGFFLPNVGDYAHATLYEGWLKSEAFRAVQLDGESLQQHYDWLMEIPVSRTIFEEMDAAGLSRPDWQKLHAAYFSKGYLVLITREFCGEEETFKRFAQVFDQTYTRFLDLQKAEAQTRESQIQLSLERIRAKAMSMQHSDELSDFLTVLFEQFEVLDLRPVNCILSLFDIENNRSTFRMTGKKGSTLIASQEIDLDASPVWKQKVENWKSGHPNDVDVLYIPYENLPEIAEIFKEILEKLPEDERPLPVDYPNGEYIIDGYCKYGYLGYAASGPPSEEEKEITRRIAHEFGNVYQRFLDLEKAEAQARESQIQLAMERVRARTMAMQHSSELGETSALLFQQIQNLGVPPWSCGFNIWEQGDTVFTSYMGSPDGAILDGFKIPLTEEATFIHFQESRDRGDKLFVDVLEGETLEAHYRYFLSLPEIKKAFEKRAQAGEHHPTFQINHLANFSHGNLLFITYEPCPEAHDIFIRFAQVFEQTYIRFLDLQKAEAQAREAQIENALEKVRSRTMAMQTSDELTDVAGLLFNQVSALGIKTWTTGFNVWSEDNNSYVDYLSLNGEIYGPNTVHTEKAEALKELSNARKSGVEFDVLYVEGEKIKQLYLAISGIDEKEYDIMVKDGLLPSQQYEHFVFGAKVSVMFITYEPVPEAHDIFKRLGKVFEQTYTRFLDLQRAEAQAREAKIETSLEKVRSRTMGMQSSEELPEVANLLFTEVRALGIHAWSCGYNILAEDKKTATCCMSSEGTIQTPFQLRLWGENSFDEMGEFVLSDHTMLVQELGDKALEEHYAHMKSFPDLKPTFDEIDRLGLSLPTYQINHLCKFTQGFILFITYEKVPESHAIFKRFTNVFDQTYTRFLDLKKAEAQAREAQIANALEKVRSRSLAMQSPDELIDVAQLLREEMGALGVEELETSSIYIQDESSRLTQCWFTIKNPDNPDKAITDQMTLDLQDTWVGRKMDEFVRSKAEQTSILMQGEQRIEWIRYCEEKSDLFGTSNFYGETIPDRTYHLYKFSNGYIGAAAPGEISTESWELLKRATAVFSFAYTRFRDLQMAQSSARAAMRQASLDRVRADISSMRNADDLGRITPLVFNELTTLGIPFIRCGVFIVHENRSNVEIYLSTPEGKSLAVMTLPFSANEMTSKSVEAWKKGEVYVQHWNQTDFINWGKSMQEQGYVKDLKTYQGAEAAPESLHLHFVPFAQGLLYVGSTISLSDEQIDLVKALAKSFAIAYARYEDFVKLEKAKAEVESAMSELKATQSQLVQQEKLASLGQLTAGIAHEIKNPLNFVNNFSEVSIELVEEALEEFEKREARDETLIRENLEDIKLNLQKVHQHGSRANGIVTSMLQHSRGGTGKKEATDLNALIQEYVNLSFHGMRAGKNPINVEIVLDLDPDLKEVSLIKEDFSRVIINLCNNAFDAMRSKTNSEFIPDSYRDHNSELYHPKLTVCTKAEKDIILIEVADNGPGIPDDIKDKILQPFFTTKKGTEGTGLGLSITHDIVKAHGGSLSIESNPNGTIFTISIPTNS